jgi:hypothetical protein
VNSRQPDPAKGEYIADDNGTIKVCKACIPATRAEIRRTRHLRHTCGLGTLQDFLRIGR